MHSRLFKLAAASLGVLALIAQSRAASQVEAVSFAHDLAPVLQQKCLACHGPEKQQGGYRLDSFEWLLKAGDNGEAPVVTGNAEASDCP